MLENIVGGGINKSSKEKKIEIKEPDKFDSTFRKDLNFDGGVAVISNWDEKPFNFGLNEDVMVSVEYDMGRFFLVKLEDNQTQTFSSATNNDNFFISTNDGSIINLSLYCHEEGVSKNLFIKQDKLTNENTVKDATKELSFGGEVLKSALEGIYEVNITENKGFFMIDDCRLDWCFVDKKMYVWKEGFPDWEEVVTNRSQKINNKQININEDKEVSVCYHITEKGYYVTIASLSPRDPVKKIINYYDLPQSQEGVINRNLKLAIDIASKNHQKGV